MTARQFVSAFLPSPILCLRTSFCVAGLLCTHAFGQGTVVFNNGTGLVMAQHELDTAFSPVPIGGGYVQLAYAPAGTPVVQKWSWGMTQASWLVGNPGWTLASPPVGFNTPAAGKFNGGTVTLNGVARGASADYLVFCWLGTVSSFDAAMSSTPWVRVSDVFRTETGGIGTPPSTPVPLSLSFGGLAMAIPEPTSFAFAVLGGALWLVNRQKRIRPLPGRE